MVPVRVHLVVSVVVVWTALLAATPTGAQTALSGDRLRITRVTGRVTIDGDLSDDAWRGAQRVEQWYETNPGDNVEPRVKSVGYLAYDDRFFYAAFEFDDPDPAAIRAPFSDHDNISGNSTDYAGVILDTRNDGHSAVLLLTTPRGVQYDAQTDDASDEDSSPDFFWDSAARITDHGWTLEVRVPFSSLRYRNVDPQTWGILLYRNYPRDFRYQIFSTRLPRGGNCFICRANTLVGLDHLPSGGHVVAAPYVSVARTAEPSGELGSPLESGAAEPSGGLDLKWAPNAENVFDFTVRPDFSQIESDTAQISTNERFALFFREKRPFFLEGVNLLRTPIQAVYTRTITAPRWGSRLTGQSRGIVYTALVADDRGGGSIVLPGANGSSLVDQDFGSYVMLARARRGIGRSFVSLLATDREAHDGLGFNRVVGPDFQWRWKREVVTGQWLFSSSRSPDRRDVDARWDGGRLTGHAVDLDWSHSTTHFDSDVNYKNFGDGFRADAGFVPQVGYRDFNGSTGWTFRPRGFARRIRTFVTARRQVDQNGVLVAEYVNPSVGMDARWNGFLQFRFINDRTSSGTDAFTRRQFGYVARFSPSRRVSQVSIDGVVGQEIDFSNSRLGHGATVNLFLQVNPTNHLEIAAVQNQRWLDVDAAGARSRLFVARVSRLRATYTFTSNLFARIVGQYVSTSRDPSLYEDEVDRRSGVLTGSMLLAYKINWQSVLFVGYGDNRELADDQRLEPASRQFFVKMSYALQR
jgi:hypothetical protein